MVEKIKFLFLTTSAEKSRVPWGMDIWAIINVKRKQVNDDVSFFNPNLR
jgi:hypothetical protein